MVGGTPSGLSPAIPSIGAAPHPLRVEGRGTATADSDLDLLVVIQQGDWRLKDAVAEVGYLLAIGTDVVPSIIVLTVEEWGRLQKREAPFWQTVPRDGVAVQ